MHRIGLIALALGVVACSGQASAPTTEQPAETSLSSTTTSIPSTITSTLVSPSATVAEEPNEFPDFVGCRRDPFTSEVTARLARDYPGKEITVHVYDARTACHYSMNPENRQLSASVFKVMVMAGTLLEAQTDDRFPTEREMDLLTPMMTQSANSPVRSLWRSFGASPWFRKQAEVFGLDETRPVGDRGESWGGTRTSAADQVDLLRQVLLGEWGPLEETHRSQALALMTAVVDEQSWGVTAGVPDSWVVAQKNGFAGSIINSVGWVDEPGESPGYVVAILTRGWPSHAKGIAAVERINLLVADSMIDRLRNLE